MKKKRTNEDKEDEEVLWHQKSLQNMQGMLILPMQQPPQQTSVRNHYKIQHNTKNAQSPQKSNKQHRQDAYA